MFRKSIKRLLSNKEWSFIFDEYVKIYISFGDSMNPKSESFIKYIINFLIKKC